MFEAIVTVCLMQAPDLCRDQLLPGFEAADLATCEAAVQARSPAVPAGMTVSCRPQGPMLDVAEVAPGVFVHMGRIAEPDADNLGDVSNLGFIVGAAQIAVIDTGTARWMGEALWRAIRHRSTLPVSHVILTHVHPDHVLGAAAFEGSGAQIVGHAALPRALADRQANYLESLDREVGAQAMLGTRVVTVDRLVSDRLVIDLGGRLLQLDAWPLAHTGTDLTVLDSATQTLFTGDLVFDRHAPALDGSLRGWREALARMEGLPVLRIVPGHGGPVLAWPGGAAALSQYLEVLERDTRAAIDAGQRLGDAVETIAASEAHIWELFEAYNPRNATVAFTELEWD